MKPLPRLLHLIILLVITLLVGSLGFLLRTRTAETVKATGIVRPARIVPISPTVSGLIETVFVREAQEVRRQALLARLADDALRAEREQATADGEQLRIEVGRLETLCASLSPVRAHPRYHEVRCTVHQARTEFLHADTLLQLEATLLRRNVGRPEELRARRHAREVACAAYAAARAESTTVWATLQQDSVAQHASLACRLSELAQCEARLRDLDRRLAALEIRAPIDGVVLTPDIELLQGCWAAQGEPILQLADWRQMRFRAQVSQSQQGRVRRGLPTRIFIDAFPHRAYKVFRGQVVEVAPQPVVVRDEICYPTMITITEPWIHEPDGTQVRLRPGMSGHVDIVVREGVPLLRLLLQRVHENQVAL